MKNQKLKIKRQKNNWLNSILHPKKERGYILISVLVIMMIMLIITYFLADALFSEVSIARNQKAATVAFNLAEAGISEAIWRIQYDPTARNEFLNSQNGQTIIPLKSLLPGGTYSVVIINTAPGAATITSSGYFVIGLKQAQRVITVNVIKATLPPPYSVNGALFVGGPNPGDLYINNTPITYDPGYDPASLVAGGNLYIGNTSINMSDSYLVNKQITFQNATITAGANIYAGLDIISKNSQVTYGGQMLPNYTLPEYNLPAVDITADCSIDANSYKCLAQNQNQYYTAAEFNELINHTTTLNGIIYVAAGGVTLKNNQTLTVNGILVSEGMIYLDNSALTINHTSGPAGLITLTNISVNNAVVKIDGLVYIGTSAAASNNANITVNGAILAHEFTANNIFLKLNFKPDWVNESIQPGTNPPVIQFQHWEEEY